MSISKLKKLGLGLGLNSFLPKMDKVFDKINEIIDWANDNTPDYKEYVANLTQGNNTNPPTATVLTNTLDGTLVWSRNSAGEYYATLAGAFPTESKVAMWLAGKAPGDDEIWWNDVNSIGLATYNGGGTQTDNLLYYRTIVIRVYN